MSYQLAGCQSIAVVLRVKTEREGVVRIPYWILNAITNRRKINVILKRVLEETKDKVFFVLILLLLYLTNYVRFKPPAGCLAFFFSLFFS